MNRDFKELLAILNAENVRYLVVGGYAVSLHAQPRATKDLDILIKPDKENANALFRALTEFGAPLSGLKPEDFSERGSFFRMGTPPVMVDTLLEPFFSGVWKPVNPRTTDSMALYATTMNGTIHTAPT